ncbi:MAG: molybdopterin-dependent oxidoreductase [Trichococcus flocculiformis]|jgi:DMSO/TMAO reductase YedYZ molybdopterin-dependent catalytic subunit|uniref:Molybdopterin-dependent oxidoreductase n=1 Tax=Trichococcus flocculiformis TaxID=82803 RepID=A0A847D469_9LACT|nr:molybdopterin-dependent oxidoreductase [Trichococcus flocculiformis]NLD31556.1 molybdopterin-dependent oxidoreductase [Trichococcus flocculiformis]HRK98943.1 molybdopterin-dependent oxidoreductase [Trichococcus flocculiformis]HRM20153.1 molybdopterin-dependent oxidoreductase [Trichococcus flocculiformis]
MKKVKKVGAKCHYNNRILNKCLVLLLSLLFFGCGTSNDDTSSQTDLQELTKIEVTEYEGKDLSSLTDFRENSIKGPQYINTDVYTLTIDGLVEQPNSLTYDEVLDNQKYTKVVTLHCVEGWSVDILWEGILLADLFEAVDIQESADTVIFHSEDGYSTALPLQTIMDRQLMIAYKMNGVVLPPERGFPFQLVAEDKLGYKWIKWITRIELSDDANYKGYWEQRGFDNEADVNP